MKFANTNINRKSGVAQWRICGFRFFSPRLYGLMTPRAVQLFR
jgi:hypothetical protein